MSQAQPPSLKRKKPANLEAKTVKVLRDQGFVYGKTEHFNGFSGRKTDLFGCIDGVAVRAGDIWFIQTCRRSDYAAHLRKMSTGTFKICGGGKDAEVSSFAATSHLTAFPSARVLIVMFLWNQPDGFRGKWEHEQRVIKFEDLCACRARAKSKG